MRAYRKVENRRAIATEWATDFTSTFGSLARKYQRDKAVIYYIVRAHIREKRYRAILEKKGLVKFRDGATKLPVVCLNCEKTKYFIPCVAKGRSFCDNVCRIEFQRKHPEIWCRRLVDLRKGIG